MRHASARNCVERIFGVVKKKFRLLSAGASYSIENQAKMVLAICALHNFIRVHDADDEDAASTEPDFEERFQYPTPANLQLYMGSGSITRTENERASERRDRIARAMWENYQMHTLAN